MRIALFTTDLAGHSGWSTYARDLSREMSKQGHSVLALVQKKIGANWCQEAELLGEAHHLLSPWVPFCARTAPIRRILEEFKPDVIHFMAEPYALLIPFLHKRKSVYCLTLHGTYAILPFRSGKITYNRMRKALEQCDHIFSVRNYTKDHLQAVEHGLWKQLKLNEKVSVLPNAIDISSIAADTGRRQQHTPSVVSIGAVKDRKGYREIIAALALLQKAAHRFRYHVYGSLSQDPEYVTGLRALIADYALADSVTLHGSVSNETLAQAYKNADAFILLSKQTETHFEGFGLVFLEANAHGVPVIGPVTGGCPEAIDDGKSGFVCDPFNAEKVAEKLQAILAGNIDRHACRQWAEKHSSVHAAATMLRTYSRLIDRKS